MIIELNNPFFKQALPILEQIESHGYEAYFVGGSVRDYLLSLEIHDIDIATSATPEEIKSIFPVTIDVGIEHGTVIVRYQGESYEITTFRVEGKYSDFRRPDKVDFVRNLEEDTLRRDFTINALAIDKEGQVYDYHGGMIDLRNELIRAVGVPTERFNEDALRMLRAIRFASQLGFEIDETTMSAIQELAPLIEKIAMERILIEFTKFLKGNFFRQQSHTLITSRLYHYLPIPEYIEIDNLVAQLNHDFTPYEEKQVEKSDVLVWGSLLYHLGSRTEQEERQLMRQWKQSNEIIQQAMTFKELRQMSLDEVLTPVHLYRYDSHLLKLLEEFYMNHGQLIEPLISKQLNQLPIQTRQEINMNGQQLMEILGMERGGPILGQLIAEIELEIVNSKLANNYEEIKNYVQLKAL
ncbi:CCA tRNA nucleotidyltransferase [Aerococcaceae bacterium DSM 111176]|nr:CCA tRNA nucleotidyltransferase [Aerococcaceae bacterium DSM 111176]